MPVPPNTGISMNLAWKSDSLPYSPVGVTTIGNLNPQTDDMPEMLVLFDGTWDDPQKKGILFYRGDGSNKHAPDTMYMPFLHSNSAPPVIGDVDGDGIPEIIVHENGSFLRVYRHFTPGNNPAMSLWMTSLQKVKIGNSGLMLADMDGDGTPEIIIGNEILIFDFTGPASPTMRKVIDGGANPSGHAFNTLPVTFSQSIKSPAAADLLEPAECNGDPDCTGLELVAGNVIYSIDLDTMDGDGFQIKIQRDLNDMETPDAFGDGFTAVTDMNLDGIPDIVVIGRGKVGLESPTLGVYVWNKNGLVRFIPIPTMDATHGILYCLPMIANVFDDTKRGFTKDFPEIVFHTYNTMYCLNLQAWHFPDISAWWFVNLDSNLFTEASATAFDFNGDGISEIVFPDDNTLRIMYGGPLPFPPGVDANRNWSTSPMSTQSQSSLYQYAVIADLDNDGQAEIAIAGGSDSYLGDFPIELRVFESGGAPWAPCRKLWNQFNYNIVNVDDDLGIPQVPQKQWLEFPAAGSGNRPLNMALAQRGPLSGTPFIPLSDLTSSVDSFYCDLDTLRLRLRVCNNGSASSPAGLYLQWYQGNPTTAVAVPFGPPYQFPAAIAKDSCAFWNLALPLPPNGTLYGIINDDGSVAGQIDLTTDFPSTNLPECDYLDNLFSISVMYDSPVLNLGPDQSVCSDAVTTLTASPGFSRYRWLDGSQNTTFTANGAGTYWVDAWDICGNLFSDTLHLLAIPTPPLSLDPDTSLCFGASLTLTTAGFDNVNWTSAGVTLCAACPSLTLDPATDITIEVTAQSGICTLRDTVFIAVLALPQITGQAIETHCGNNDGSINILINSALPYQILWSDGQTAPDLSGLPAAAYTVTVTNNAGCSQSETYVVAGSTSVILDPAVVTNVLCFGEQTGSISVSLNSGTPPYVFNWPTGAGSNVLNGLQAGTYSLTVNDNLGCTAVSTYQVTEPPVLQLMATVDSTSCTIVTGNITVAPQGGTSPYLFAWAGGQNTPALNGLAPGNYLLTVTDNNLCTVTQTFDIQPGGSPVISDSLVFPVRCFGESTGEISVTASLGLPPYQFLWSTGPGTSTLPNLAAGNYAVTATDANGCSATAQFFVGQPGAISLQSQIDSTSCTSTTGNISVAGQGGIAPFGYVWNGGQVTPALFNLDPGTYTVTIADANGCTTQESFTLAPGGAPVLSNSEITPVACTGETNGQITVDVNGGLPPYQYMWSTGAVDALVDNLPAGNYSFTATDNNGCLLTVQFTVTEPPALSISATVDSTSCTSSTGNISVSPQGGTAPYTFLWNGGQTMPAIGGLPPGDYNVTITDSNGCTASDVYTILAGGAPFLADSVVTHVTCFGQNNGSISVQTTGIGPFQWNWSTGSATDTLNNLSAGVYQLTITDANNCTTVASFTVETPEVVTAALTTVADTCGQTTGAISVQPEGGTAPYTYLWSDGQSNEDLTNISAGVWLLTITDANGCTFVQNAEVFVEEVLPQFFVAGDTITCSEPTVQLTPIPAPTNWIFEWQTPNGTLLSGATQNLNLSGQYLVTAVNELGCSATSSVDVASNTIAPMAMASESELVLPCGPSSVNLDGSGSSTGASFSALWHLENNGQVVWDTVAYVAQAGVAGTYVLQITDLSNGCSDFDTVQVTLSQPIEDVEVAVDSISCFGLEDGGISVVSITGGAAPYLYALNNQAFGQADVFTGLTEGNYTLFVLDANGCTWESDILQMVEPASFTINLNASRTRIDQGQAVILTAQVQPLGTVLGQILWSPAALFSQPVSLIQTVQPTESTLFQIEVEDGNGCVASDTVRVHVRKEAIYVPNVFQPGSLDNSMFTVYAGTDIIEVRLMRVYDRWGELVFENRRFPPNDPSLGWDGTFRNEPMGQGVYVYYIVVE
ncbi:MAG: gliding motility-associated C-terminal domain-containing protein, partial [Saprospiraceae bacterium]|nr:gliding motility-associated C-terminal domain-containing protein [Saprospiraceae bacterium]